MQIIFFPYLKLSEFRLEAVQILLILGQSVDEGRRVSQIRVLRVQLAHPSHRVPLLSLLFYLMESGEVQSQTM